VRKVEKPGLKQLNKDMKYSNMRNSKSPYLEKPSENVPEKRDIKKMVIKEPKKHTSPACSKRSLHLANPFVDNQSTYI